MWIIIPLLYICMCVCIYIPSSMICVKLQSCERWMWDWHSKAGDPTTVFSLPHENSSFKNSRALEENKNILNTSVLNKLHYSKYILFQMILLSCIFFLYYWIGLLLNVHIHSYCAKFIKQKLCFIEKLLLKSYESKNMLIPMGSLRRKW